MNLSQKIKRYSASAAAAVGLSSCVSTGGYGPGVPPPPAYGSGGIGYAPPIAPALSNGYFNGGPRVDYRAAYATPGYNSFAEIRARQAMIGREIAYAQKSGDYRSEFNLRVERERLLEASRIASGQLQTQRNLSNPINSPAYQVQRQLQFEVNRQINQAFRNFRW